MEKLLNKVVLIVDDEDGNIFALSNYLESLQMITKTAKNGKEAIAQLENGLKPDVILLDMMMPVMDGYETAGLLRQSNELKHIPVIALTARAMKGDREKCLEAGAWDYISKPIDVKLLVSKLRQWIE